MPYFPGPWFSKQDMQDDNGIFEVSMLALLKPWRSLTNLKDPNQSFCDAYNDFLDNASYDTCHLMRNVQFFHECGEHAQSHEQIIETADEPAPTTAWTNIEQVPDGPSLDEDVSKTNFEKFVMEDDI